MKKNIVYLFTLFICCSCIQSVTSSQHTTKKIVNKTEKEFFYEVYTDVGNKSIFVHPLDSSIVYFYRENPKTQILIGGTIFLFTSMLTGQRKRLDRWEAGILFGFYIIYTTYLVMKEI